MRILLVSVLLFVGVTALVACLIGAIWIALSFQLGGNAEGAFGVSPFLALLFLPLLLAAPAAGVASVARFRRNAATSGKQGQSAKVDRGAGESIADALAQHQSHERVTAVCPACHSVLAVSAGHVAYSISVKCKCGLCAGEFHTTS